MKDVLLFVLIDTGVILLMVACAWGIFRALTNRFLNGRPYR